MLATKFGNVRGAAAMLGISGRPGLVAPAKRASGVWGRGDRFVLPAPRRSSDTDWRNIAPWPIS